MKKIDFVQGGSFLSFLLQGEASLEEKKTLFELLDPSFTKWFSRSCLNFSLQWYWGLHWFPADAYPLSSLPLVFQARKWVQVSGFNSSKTIRENITKFWHILQGLLRRYNLSYYSETHPVNFWLNSELLSWTLEFRQEFTEFTANTKLKTTAEIISMQSSKMTYFFTNFWFLLYLTGKPVACSNYQ